MSMREEGASVLEVGGRFIRLAVFALLLLVAAGGVVELFLRRMGAEPQNLYRVGFSATVIDRWTEWAMRPNVRLNEYAVTNAYGLHEDREINLQKPPGVKRVAVVGSSVTWGLGEALENTIPRSAERSLNKAGCQAEVLNYGNQGFNILNASAYIQSKIHQFNPDAVVVMMDLQMGFPRFPMPNPITDEQAVVRRLDFFEGLFKRASEYSVVLTSLDNLAGPRDFLARRLPFPLEAKQAAQVKPSVPASEEYGRKELSQLWQWIDARLTGFFDRLKAKDAGQSIAVAPAKPLALPPAQAQSIAEYEARHERELGSVVAGLSAFARQMGIRLYFVTPYGPYFHATPQELAKFSLNMLTEADPLYGGLTAATQREAELASAIITRHAEREGARVIDMLARSREATMATGDFSTDGIHFSAQGYRHVGTIIAERLLRDGLCSEKPATGRGG